MNETTREFVLARPEIEQLEWEPFGDIDGALTKTLWKDAATGSYAGLLRMDAGASIPAHTHPAAVHHMWVEQGACEIAGKWIGAGSYMFVHPGTEHEISSVGPTGCLMFYLYLTARRVR